MQVVIRIILGLCSLTIFGLAVIVCYEVLVRSLFNNPTSWVVELSSYLFLWLALLSAAVAIADDRQLRIDFIINRLKGRPRAAAEIVVLLLMLAMMVVSVYYGVFYFLVAYEAGWVHSWGRLFVPMAYTRAALPVVGTLIIIFLLIKIWRETRKALGWAPDTPRDDVEDAPPVGPSSP